MSEIVTDISSGEKEIVWQFPENNSSEDFQDLSQDLMEIQLKKYGGTLRRLL